MRGQGNGVSARALEGFLPHNPVGRGRDCGETAVSAQLLPEARVAILTALRPSAVERVRDTAPVHLIVVQTTLDSRCARNQKLIKAVHSRVLQTYGVAPQRICGLDNSLLLNMMPL